MDIGNDEIMWHACRKVDLDRILAEGLVPSESRSQSTAIYLSDDRFTAENYANFDPDVEWVVLAIRFDALDAGHLGPDDYELPEIFEALDGDALSEHGWDEDTDWRDLDWKASLAVCNQVTYDALIPPSAFTVHGLEFGQKPMVL